MRTRRWILHGLIAALLLAVILIALFRATTKSPGDASPEPAQSSEAPPLVEDTNVPDDLRGKIDAASNDPALQESLLREVDEMSAEDLGRLVEGPEEKGGK